MLTGDESGLGLDAAMRKVCEEMSHHKALCEELTLANFQLQMGRPRREVLHDLAAVLSERAPEVLDPARAEDWAVATGWRP